MKKEIQKKNSLFLLQQIFHTLHLYLKSQVILMSVNTLVFWLILSYLKVHYAVYLAILTGVLSTIPFVGMLSAAVITVTVSLLDGYAVLSMSIVLEALLLFGIYIIGNQLIDWILSPFIVGKTVKIHPLILLIAVFAGTALFGLPGTFLAIPTLLVLRTIGVYFKNKKI